MGACLTLFNEPLDGFDRQLLLDASFEDEDLQLFRVAISGANNDEPVDGTEVSAGLFQAALGVDRTTPSSTLEISLAEATSANGNIHDVSAAVAESIGSIPNNFGPGDSVGGSCGGFPE